MTIDDLIELTLHGKTYLDKVASGEEVQKVQQAIDNLVKSKEVQDLQDLLKKKEM